jgi:LysM repeat protein
MSRQSVIAAAKRNQFQQKQQVNRLYAQKLAQGLSPAQAATSVTVADGQSLDSIAQKNGTDVQSLLAANPDMTAPKTGMVLNLPRPGFAAGPQIAAIQGRTKDDLYGGGLPSNAALGGTTTNPQGNNAFQPGAQVNPWQGVTPGYNQQLKPNTALNSGMGVQSNQFAQYQHQTPAAAKTPYPVYAQNIGNIPNIVGKGPYPPFAQNVAAVQQGQAQISAPAIKNAGTAFAPTFRTKDDYLPTQLAAQVNLLGLNPTADQLAYLEKYGMITKTPQPAYSGGGGYYRGRHHGGGGRGGGGGGFGSGKTPKGQQQPSLPAFSSGAGFNGLVNWRI